MAANATMLSYAGGFGVFTIAAPSNVTINVPLLVSSKLVVPLATAATGVSTRFLYKAEKLLVTAPADSAGIAAVNFVLLAKVYWDDTAKKFTNVSTSNTLVGRTLEAKDYSGGVVSGNQLVIEFNPDIV